MRATLIALHVLVGDPAEAQRFVDRLRPRQARLAGMPLVKADDQLVRARVVLREPGAERGGRREEARFHGHAVYARIVALDLIAELEQVLDAFEADGISYALCGGLALAVHGHPRATMDIDLLVPGSELDRALVAAKRAGFDVPARKMTFGLRAGTPREVQRVSKLDPQTGELLALDLLVVNTDLEPVWNSRETLRSGSRQIVVVSREGLATMKKIAGRKQDLADIARLEGKDDDER